MSDAEASSEALPCRQLGLIGECGARRPCPQHDPPTALAVALADVLMMHADDAARASHRPLNVEHLFIDANARHVFAAAIIAMPEMLAIREFLKACSFDRQCEFFGLPTSVIDWALS